MRPRNPYLGKLASLLADQLEQRIEQFEDAWLGGTRPSLDEFLAGCGQERERAALLVELIHSDLEFRLKAGDAARVEEYLKRYPELGVDQAILVDLLVRELQLRRRNEPALTSQEIAHRFPDHVAEVGERLNRGNAEPRLRTGPQPSDVNGRTTISQLMTEHGRDGHGHGEISQTLPCVPGYRILDILGRGGMGVVYKAEHLQLRRGVALKMIRGESADPEVRARFKIEALAVARLQHPNIVQIHEVGEFNQQPFFSLELVGGGSLSERIRKSPPTDRESAQIMELIARAVHAAHEQGIIHRDLKPGNVLLTEAGIPKITDFGLAKQQDDDSGQTRTGMILGTPSYMSPEQAAGDSRAIGPLADVWALGAIFYEMLTGRPPFRGVSVHETLQQVLNQPPTPPRQIRPNIPRDLETICLKCLEKERDKRYATADTLADDLQRFQRGETIQARPVGRIERAWRWCRRYPAITTLGLLLFVALTTGLAFSLYFARSSAENADEAQLRAEGEKENAKQAQENEKRAKENEKRAEFHAEESHRKETLAKENERRAQRFLYGARANRAMDFWLQHDVGLMNQTLSLMAPEEGADSVDLRAWEFFYLQRWSFRNQLRTFSYLASPLPLESTVDVTRDLVFRGKDRTRLYQWGGFEFYVTAIAISADGKHVAVAGGHPKVLLFEMGTGKLVRSYSGPSEEYDKIALDPLGRFLAATDGKGAVSVWNMQSAELLRSLQVSYQPSGFAHQFCAVAFSPDGKYLGAGGGVDKKFGELRVWQVGSWDALQVVTVDEAWRGQVRFWDFQEGKELKALEVKDQFKAVAVSPDGRYLAAVTFSAHLACFIYVWDARTGNLIHKIADPNSKAYLCVGFTPDGRQIAAAGTDDIIRIFNVKSAEPYRTLTGHTHYVYAFAFSPDGLRLVSGGGDYNVILWDMTSSEPTIPRLLPGTLAGMMDMSPDGKYIATEQYGRLQYWSTELATVVPMFTNIEDPTERPTGHPHFSPCGKWLVTASKAKDVKDTWIVTVWNWALRDWKPKNLLAFTLKLPLQGLKNPFPTFDTRLPIAFARSGNLLAVPGEQGSVCVVEIPSGVIRARLPGNGDRPNGLAFGGDDRWLAVASGKEAVVWDWEKGEKLPKIERDNQRQPLTVAFSQDGKQLAVAGHGNISLHEMPSGKRKHFLLGHTNYISSVIFSPGGKRLFSIGGGWGRRAEVKIWDTVGGLELIDLRGHDNGTMEGMALSANAELLATQGDYYIKLWDNRFPTRAVREDREARDLTRFLFDTPMPRAEVIAIIEKMPSLTEEVRTLALQRARIFPEVEDAKRYLDVAREVLLDDTEPSARYAQAMTQVQIAADLQPAKPTKATKGDVLTALGMAHYRTHRYLEAIDKLTQADKANKGHPVDLAFLAMSHFRFREKLKMDAMVSQKLGLTPVLTDPVAHREKARTHLQRLRDAMLQPRWSADESCQIVAREAEKVLDSPEAD